MLFNLKANGVAIEDVAIIYYADNGLDVYGNAFLANPAFLQAKPDAVQAFVRAAARGWRDAIADPKAAMVSLGKHNKLAKLDIEASGWLGSAATRSSRRRRARTASAPMIAIVSPQNIGQVAKAFGLARIPDDDRTSTTTVSCRRATSACR